MSGFEKLSSNKSFEGWLNKYKFTSEKLGGLPTQINVFLPKEAEKGPVPVLYYLAGLTCTEDTGAQKGGFLRDAAAHGLALVFPDTSPRGAGIESEEKDWDFGTGAGFYVNATKEPWKKAYNMYDYITQELPAKLATSGLPLDTKTASIMGHSMGGHGAVTLYLSQPEGTYRSASGFAAILNPTRCPWGEKAFGGYYAGGVEEGKKSDATELIKSVGKSRKIELLLDQGTEDNFYKQGQLLPENFVAAAKEAGVPINVNFRDGYDHSYYFISTFGPDHIAFHAKHLKA